MSKKRKYSYEDKVWAVNQYLEGNMSAAQIAEKLNMTKNGNKRISEWVKHYQESGTDIFLEKSTNRKYTKAFKQQVVQEYLDGNGSCEALAAKYKIPSHTTVLRWVRRYNNGQENKDYLPRPEVYMAPRKKTTLEERKTIVQYCLDHDRNYKDTAAQFGCSYSQVRDWTLKFIEGGEEALQDRRGRKVPEEELTTEQKLQKEIEQLKQRNQYLEMENELLKKAEEMERRAIKGFRKR